MEKQRRLALAVDQVVHSQNRVFQQHARASVHHDFAHPLAHLRLVTMDSAFGAGGFVLPKRTARQASQGIILHLLAVTAQFLFFQVVVITAVQADHDLDRFSFTPDSGMVCRQGTLLEKSIGTIIPYVWQVIFAVGQRSGVESTRWMNRCSAGALPDCDGK